MAWRRFREAPTALQCLHGRQGLLRTIRNGFQGMRQSRKFSFFGSYLHPQFAMGPRHSQEPSWVSGVNKISEERGRCACAHAQTGNMVTHGASSRPISACSHPKPASATTGDNNNTITTIMTFIKCVREGRTAQRGVDTALCVNPDSGLISERTAFIRCLLLSIQGKCWMEHFSTMTPTQTLKYQILDGSLMTGSPH